MSVEIERKFLVTDDGWKRDLSEAPALLYWQGYLCNGLIPGEPTVRVRLAGNKGYLTVKGPPTGISRPEYEYPIPGKDAQEMLERLCRGCVTKHRHRVLYEGTLWEVDVFCGGNARLVLAEVELASEDQEVRLPPWVGQEVSDRVEYTNAFLSAHPFSEWCRT